MASGVPVSIRQILEHATPLFPMDTPFHRLWKYIQLEEVETAIDDTEQIETANKKTPFSKIFRPVRLAISG